jgi:RNA polymerase sigma-70 factor (family 1)
MKIMPGNVVILQLVKRLADDDKKALDEIYHLYFPKLYVFSRNFLKVDDDIRDILQEVFISIWKNRKKINNAEAFDGYIFTVTKNALITYFRQKMKFHEFEARVKQMAVTEEFPEDFFIYNDLKEHAGHIIDALPEKRREIFRLSRELGLTHREISEKLGISVKTVEDHIMYMNRFLRSNLKKLGI